MPLFTVTVDPLTLTRERLAAARALLEGVVIGAVVDACDDAVMMLSAAAPHGVGGDPPAGDAPGPLAQSFQPSIISGGVARASGIVRTTQPTKLKFNRFGTGIFGPTGQRITPRSKRALFWPNADHPVRSVAGMTPDDFVTPLLPIMRDRAMGHIAAAAQLIQAALTGG